MIGEAFRERYVLTRFPTGGLIVDLLSGNYFDLNPSATAICEALSSNDTEAEACEGVRRALGVPIAEAAAIVASTLRGLTVPSVRGTPQGTYRFLPQPTGYALFHGEKAVLEVDRETLTVKVPSGVEYSVRALELYLRNLAPKVLFLRDIAVLHGAAITRGEALVAFSGVSGAGKTTTARAFASEGATLVSEDLLVFAPSTQQGFRVVVEAESFVHEWAKVATNALDANPDGAISTTDLRGATAGPTLPLSAIYFLDAARRTGLGFAARPIRHAHGLAAIMNNKFLASASPEDWRRFTGLAAALSRSANLFEMTVPSGTELLQSAVRDYKLI